MIFSKGNENLGSFIGAKRDFQEGLNVKGTLRVDGRIDGKLNAECLILGETAVVNLNVVKKASKASPPPSPPPSEGEG